MCTVTFLPHPAGYALGMNRDEQRTRVVALPPERRAAAGRVIVQPREPHGGTWIAVNDRQCSLALINWYSIHRRAPPPATSRGIIAEQAATAMAPAEVAATLNRLPLDRLNPFRLIGIFPERQAVREWRWDLLQLDHRDHPWRAQQWISSGFDEPMAQRLRGEAFARAADRPSFGTLGWLRELHASHEPERGPFSTCMHRTDAVTVSYTEIAIDGDATVMRYRGTAPCQSAAFAELSLPLGAP